MNLIPPDFEGRGNKESPYIWNAIVWNAIVGDSVYRLEMYGGGISAGVSVVKYFGKIMDGYDKYRGFGFVGVKTPDDKMIMVNIE